MACHLPDHPVLPGDVTGVLDLRFQPLRQHGGDLLSPADDARHQRVADLGTAQQFLGNAALGGGGKTGGFHGGAQVCGAQMRLVQAAALGLQDLLGVLVLCPAVVLHKAVFPADGGQALVGVILPQGQPVLAAAGHHAVGVHDALGHKVVHQRAQIAGVPGQHQLLHAQRVAGGIQTRQQTLRGGFLVAGGAVELPCAVQPPHHLAFQRGFQTGGVYAVVLDGVGGAHDLQMLKTPDAVVEGVLHILRQAAGRTLQIHLLSVLAAGLHEERVAVLARKAHHLILNGGAVARADTLDHAAVQRAALDVIQNDLMGLGVRVGDPALHLVVHGCIGQKAEGLQFAVRVAGLAFQLGKINAAAVHPGRGAGLEPAQRQTGGFQAVGQGVGGVHPIRAGGIPRIAHKNFAAEVRTGGKHHALGGVLAVQLGDNALHMTVLDFQRHYLGLMDGKPRGLFQRVLHVFVVAAAVGLHPQCVHGRALALVQHPALQIGGVCRQTHHTAQRVHLPHQRALGGAANAGIAGHIADGVQTHGKDGRFCAQHSSCVGGFDARMTGANDDDIIIS